MGLSVRRKSRHLAWRPFKNDNGDKMSGFLPLRPGLWWMRRWHLPGKLITLGVLMAGALAMTATGAPWWAVALAAAVVLYALCSLYMGLASDLQNMAHAMEQTTRGTRVQDIPGVAGDRLVSDIVTQADRAPGWVEYDITNPATGAVQTKMSYVSRVGDWYVGCGVYKSLAAR